MDYSFSRLQEERERQAQLRGPPKIDPDVAATSIQKVDKGSVLTFKNTDQPVYNVYHKPVYTGRV